MTQIKAPYNFVPLNKEVYTPNWSNQISHDVPFEDGESGVIEITIKNISPIFVRNGHSKNNNSEFSAHIPHESSNKHYFIPATSIKGMLRSVMEILSFGKLDKYNNGHFGYRNFSTEVTDNHYVDTMKNSKPGWLSKTGDEYFLTPCNGDVECIEIETISKKYPNYKENDTVDKKQKSVSGEKLYPEEKDAYDNLCNLVCTGPMDNKKNEYLFPIDKKPQIKLSQEIIDLFIIVHKRNKLFESYFLSLLNNGKSIPVFFLYNKGNSSENMIHSIGIARKYKYPYKYNIKNCINQIKNENNKIDLSEAIFGYIDTEEKKSLRGRVQIGHAFANRLVNDTELKSVSGVLGEPSASYYPLYLKHTENKYNTYDSEKVEIAGRKRYRIHEGTFPSQLPQSEKNEEVTTTFKPLPTNLEFKLKISFHNLKPIEIGALISAITLHNNKDVWHNIGVAKGYGYGKIVCNIDNLKELKYTQEEYLAKFEDELSTFTYNKIKNIWCETDVIQSLLGIAAEHKSDDLKIMDLKEYTDGKKNTNFSILKENKTIGNSYVEKNKLIDDLKKKKHEKYDVDIAQAEANCKYEEVIKLCNELAALYLLDDIDISDIEIKIQTNKEKLEKQKQLAKLEEEKRREEQNAKKLEAGLAFLEEKDLNGNYKVKDFDGAKKRIDAWVKKTNTVSLSDNDTEILVSTLTRIYKTLTKPKDIARWEKFNDGAWKSIVTWIGENKSNELFNTIIKKL